MGRAQWDRVKSEYPWMYEGPEGFVERMAANPDIVPRLLADMYDLVKTQEEKRQGIVKRGRRPKRIPESEREFWATVLPPVFSYEPFGKALNDLMDQLGLTQRALARKAPVTQAQLSRMINGQSDVSMRTMELLAQSLDVGPWYFVEWRAGYFAQMVEAALVDRPELGIAMVKRWKQEVVS